MAEQFWPGHPGDRPSAPIVLLQAHHASRPIGGNGPILITGYEARHQSRHQRQMADDRDIAVPAAAWPIEGGRIVIGVDQTTDLEFGNRSFRQTLNTL